MRVGCQRGFALLLVMAVAVAGNLHLPLVQAIAWSRMYGQYREHYSPEVAMKITFSGEYPCALCKIVQTAETERSKFAGLTTLTFQQLLPLTENQSTIAVVPAPMQSWAWIEGETQVPQGSVRPEVPPPRLV